MLGMYGAALLKEAGYTKVFCVDINRSRLSRVVEFGGIPVHPEHGNSRNSYGVFYISIV